MPIVWPPTLPVYPLADAYSEGLPNNQLRSQPSAGPAKVRPKGSPGPRPLRASFLLTSDQVDTLYEFAETTLGHGTLRFQWTHPRTGATIETRMVAAGDKLVDVAPVNGGLQWTADIVLEIMP